MVTQKILTYLYTIAGNFSDYVLPLPFQNKVTLLFPSGGLINKRLFMLELFNVIFPFKMKLLIKKQSNWFILKLSTSKIGKFFVRHVVKDIRKG